ncbi:MAG: hypothetical protein PF630_05790 [Gammaproteobacteria bacterium]|jgi:hypothetical protein|nr:hypothetical protein [Gammaproteobacteria bacterium]
MRMAPNNAQQFATIGAGRSLRARRYAPKEETHMKHIHSISIAVIVMALIHAAPASAQKTYTPAQLRSMVQSGNYPEQGSPSTQTKSTDYASCIAQVESVVASVRPNYPSQTVVSTNLMRMEKIWTNDAAMTLTCSAADKKLVITSAPYL